MRRPSRPRSAGSDMPCPEMGEKPGIVAQHVLGNGRDGPDEVPGFVEQEYRNRLMALMGQVAYAVGEARQGFTVEIRPQGEIACLPKRGRHIARQIRRPGSKRRFGQGLGGSVE